MDTIQYESLKSITQNAGQAHLLDFWPELDVAERKRLARVIQEIDWELIPRMRQLIDQDAPAAAEDIVPAPVRPADRIETRRACEEGADAIAAGKVAALLVAGGQGTRLGFEGPKGAFPIGPVSNASLFEIHARKILALEQRHETSIPFMVMTSAANDSETRAFFESRAFFGLNPKRVWFFKQGMLPAMLPDGRLALEAPGRVFMAPDGHGGAPEAMRRAGLFDKLAARGVETVFYFQVDNPLSRIADPEFIGRHRRRQARMSLKVCAKRSPDEGLGVVAIRDGQHVVVEYTELTEALKQARNSDGSLQFGFGSVAIHVFALDFLASLSEHKLPLHRAFKKIAVCDEAGRTHVPPAPNGFKFERFIFDALPLAGNVTLMPFERADEFAPLKNARGDDSPESVRLAMTCRFARWLEAAGVEVPRDASGIPLFAIEIDPAFAADAGDLRQHLPDGFSINKDVILDESITAAPGRP